MFESPTFDPYDPVITKMVNGDLQVKYQVIGVCAPNAKGYILSNLRFKKLLCESKYQNFKKEHRNDKVTVM